MFEQKSCFAFKIFNQKGLKKRLAVVALGYLATDNGTLPQPMTSNHGEITCLVYRLCKERFYVKPRVNSIQRENGC